jgi:two-component system, LytTR family, sensor histidine kinase AlgZ
VNLTRAEVVDGSSPSLWRAPPTRNEAVALLGVLVLVPFGLVWMSGDWEDFGRNYVMSFLVGACMLVAIRSLYQWVVPRLIGERVLSTAGKSIAHGATILVGTALGTELAGLVLHQTHGVAWGAVRSSGWRIGLVVSTVVVVSVVTLDALRARVLDAELERERARNAALLAELRAIEARIEPHFLFNSLNTVAALIGPDPQRAEKVLAELSDLFRYVVTVSKRDLVPANEELAAVRHYLDIQQLRLGDRLTWSIEGGGTHAIPPHTILPLVENAIVHGIAPDPRGGRVDVRVHSGEIVVEDTGRGPQAGATKGTGTALGDLRERLRLRYGPGASVAIEPRAGGGTIARIQIPSEIA